MSDSHDAVIDAIHRAALEYDNAKRAELARASHPTFLARAEALGAELRRLGSRVQLMSADTLGTYVVNVWADPEHRFPDDTVYVGVTGYVWGSGREYCMTLNTKVAVVADAVRATVIGR